MERIVIAGGGRAAQAAAMEIRRHRTDCQIVMLEAGRYPGADVTALGQRLGASESELSSLLAVPVSALRDRFHIDVRQNQSAIDVDTSAQTVTVAEPGRANDLTLAYDSFVFATGAVPLKPDVSGNSEATHSVRTADDAARIAAHMEEKPIRSVVVLGGNYIGLTLAEPLVARGCALTVLNQSDSVVDGLEPEIAEPIAESMSKHGVTVRSNETLSGVEVGVVYLGSDAISCDFVLSALGSAPNVELASTSGLQLGDWGGIATDVRQATSADNVWAAGDCTEHRHALTDAPALWPGVATAHGSGTVAGANLAGVHRRVAPTLGTMGAKLFGIEFGRTGLDRNQAVSAGWDARCVVIEGSSRVETSPGGRPLKLAMIYDAESGRLLGLQTAGEEHTASPIAAAATAISAGMGIDDLAKVDLGYLNARGSLGGPLIDAITDAIDQNG